jgi:ectoine hydroxylase-related dioxygenase (phytanoyl-CoA dioxygenase family)
MLVESKISATFERDGFYVAENLFSASEVQNAKEEIRHVLADIKAEQEKFGQPRNTDNGVYVGLSIKSPLFRQLNADPRVLDIWEEIFGPNIEFWSDKVVYKSAAVDFGSPWHQDWQYWKGANKYSVWIALDDATPENGCLKFIPGSHKSVVVHAGKDEEGVGFTNRLRREDIDESKAVIVPAAKGSAVFFHDLTLHSSYPNKSGKDRWALISTYRDASKDDLLYEFAKAAFLARGTRTGKDLAAAGH